MNNLEQQPGKILTREQAVTLLSDLYDPLVAVVREGLSQFVTHFPAEMRSRARPRTLSGMLNDCIVHAATEELEDDGDISIVDQFAGKFFVVAQAAALRFKKVDDDERPRNYPTDRQVGVTNQYLELPGIEVKHPTVVNVGYRPDKLLTEIKSLSLICWRGDNMLWQIPIADEVQVYLFDHNGNANHTSAPLVRPKITARKSTNA